MPVQWRPQLQYSDTGRTTSLHGPEDCLYGLSKWYICTSQCPYKLEDALTYPRVKNLSVKNLLFQADFIACNPPLPRNFFSTRFRRWFDLMMIFAHTFLCNANKLSTGFTIWPHSFDSNPNNILTSLFFLKNSSKRLLSAQLRVKISNFHREFHNLSGTFSNYPWLTNMSTWS